MRNVLGAFGLYCCIVSMSGCQTQNQQSTVNIGSGSGLYIIAHVGYPGARMNLENQMVIDLAQRGIKTYASYVDFPNIDSIEAVKVKEFARGHKVLGVLLIRQLPKESELNNLGRHSDNQATLKTFYEHSKSLSANAYTKDEEVRAGVSLYALDGGDAKIFWHGETWSFRADGEGNAIRDISQTIAEQVSRLKDRFR